MRSLFLRFEVESHEGEMSADEIVDDIASRCWRWVADSDHVRDEMIPESWEAGEHVLDENESAKVTVSDQRCEGGRFWRMTRDEWGNKDSGLKYVNYIFVARDGERVEFSLLQDVVRQLDRVGPPIEDVHPPGIVRELIEDYKCNFQGEVLSGEWDMVPSARTEDFVKRHILSPTRVLPIVLVSKVQKTGVPMIEQIGTLSSILSGIAHVHIMEGHDTRRFDSLFGRQQLYNGTIRIFWPGMTGRKLNDPAWDDMYTSRKFEELYESEEDDLIQALINKICSSTSSVPASSKLVKTVRGRIEGEQRELEREEMEKTTRDALEKLKTSDDKVSYLKSHAERLQSESGKMKLDIAQKDLEITEMGGQIDSLKFQIQKIVDELSGYKQLERAISTAKKRNPDKSPQDFIDYVGDFGIEDDPENEPEPEPEFKSLMDAVTKAKMDFRRLTFLDEAISSSEESESDVDPSKVYDIFKWLNDHLWGKIKHEMEIGRRSKSGRNYVHSEMRRYLGKKYAESESPLTMDRYGSEKNRKGRLFPIKENVQIRMLPHIKLGSNVPLRIHLVCLDEKSNVEVVESFTKGNGDVAFKSPKKKKAGDVLDDFPSILIGWCGDHLPVARKNG